TERCMERLSSPVWARDRRTEPAPTNQPVSDGAMSADLERRLNLSMQRSVGLADHLVVVRLRREAAGRLQQGANLHPQVGQQPVDPVCQPLLQPEGSPNHSPLGIARSAEILLKTLST